MRNVTPGRLRAAALRLCALCALAAQTALPALPTGIETDDPPPAEPAAEAPAAAAEDAPVAQVFEELSVEARSDRLIGVADSATEGTVGRRDLELRPIARPGELLEAVPGLILTQHSGGGKANQFFLRGFNLDHGTDFRVTVAGVPVNTPTHGHGQGYADLNFLIPELVAGIDFRKGPYSADQGDFASAGAAELDYVTHLEEGLARVGAGELGFRRLLAADGFALGGGDAVAALELGESDGPWQNPDDFRRGNALLRWSRNVGDVAWRATATGYASEWNATDQIPARALADGRLDRFGGVDDTDGGEARRASLVLDRARQTGAGVARATGYLLYSDLDLYSNFTYFLADPVNGDQFEQIDERWVAGGSYERTGSARRGGRDVLWTAGADLRFDRIDNGLFATRARERLATTRRDEIDLLSGGPYAEAHVTWTDGFRTVLGWRLDLYRADVASDLAANSGDESHALGSPKLGLVWTPGGAAGTTEVYLNAGYGFHSNDARGATLRVDPATGEPVAPADPLVRSRGADLGVRGEWLPGLSSTLSLFGLDIDSELVFVGDAGTTDAGRPSRRTGVEWTNFWRVRPGLAIEADVALSRARFRDDDPAGDRIPGSVERAASVAAYLDDLGRFSGGLRLRYFGPRDLVEDGSVRSEETTLVHAEIGYALSPRWRVALECLNLLDEQASDIDYFYASRLPGEPAEGIDDRHFHPSEPRAFRLSLETTF